MSLLQNYRRQPVTFVRGSGCWLESADGERYLDLVAGIAVHALGHSHPKIVQAVTRQAAELMHCSNLYGNTLSETLAARLCTMSGMSGVFFCNSGTEANEAAFKLVRRHWWRNDAPERKKICYASGSFHGRTLGSLAATDNQPYREGFGDLPPGYHRIELNNVGDLESIDHSTAAAIVEPVQGESGVHAASAEWLRAVRKRCNAVGAILIFDEVQCGLGRTGANFAFQRFGVEPDAITLAKSLGGGLPLGALLVSERLVGAFAPGDHGATFGGNPVACAAALAFFDVLESEELASKALTLGDYFASALRKLAALHQEYIGQVRAYGLMIAADVRAPAKADEIVGAALRQRVLVMTAGGNSLRFLPALIITEAEIDEGIRRFGAALASLNVVARL